LISILGVRDTNLAFEARIPGHAAELVPGTGSHLIFVMDRGTTGLMTRSPSAFENGCASDLRWDANYTWTHEIDNALNSSFVSDLQTGLGAGFTSSNGPTDSFVGTTTLVTDPKTGQTNANGAFTASKRKSCSEGRYFLRWSGSGQRTIGSGAAAHVSR